MTWVYAVPIWVVCMLFVGGASALASVGLLFVRTRRHNRGTSNDNDVAGPIMSTLGTILAVMLSFMVVTVWQEYDQAAALVQTEVSQIDNLYDEAGIFPLPTRDNIQASIRQYVDEVTQREWPLMRSGRSSAQAHRIAAKLVTLVETYVPTTPAMQTAQADALHHAHAFIDARGDRLFANQQSVPPLLWIVMLFSAAVTLCSGYFFSVPDARAHVAMTVAVGAVIGAIFVVIAELDLPFRGELQITPTAFAQSYAVFADDATLNSKYLRTAPKSTQR